MIHATNFCYLDSPALQLQVPFGTKQPTRRSVLGKHDPRPSKEAPVPAPSTSKKHQKTEEQAQSFNLPESSDLPRSEPEPEREPELGHQERTEAASGQALLNNEGMLITILVLSLPLHVRAKIRNLSSLLCVCLGYCETSSLTTKP